MREKNLSPKQRQAAVYYRSEAVKKYVLTRANGICEGCGCNAPFLNRKRRPYLEPHHTTRRADGGPDAPAHVIALCPTCHRRVHHGLDGGTFNVGLIERLEGIEAAAIKTDGAAG
jgi:5-methylcytosine-specific restriction protein A